MKQPKVNLWNIALIALTAGFILWHLGLVPVSAAEVPAGALVVDVRTPGEYASGHYKDAVNIPLGGLNARLAELGDKNRTIVVYCRSGRRSGIALRILEDEGFTKVVDGGGLARMGL